jgi:hypothetical protein
MNRSQHFQRFTLLRASSLRVPTCYLATDVRPLLRAQFQDMFTKSLPSNSYMRHNIHMRTYLRPINESEYASSSSSLAITDADFCPLLFRIYSEKIFWTPDRSRREGSTSISCNAQKCGQPYTHPQSRILNRVLRVYRTSPPNH